MQFQSSMFNIADVRQNEKELEKTHDINPKVLKKKSIPNATGTFL